MGTVEREHMEWAERIVGERWWEDQSGGVNLLERCPLEKGGEKGCGDDWGDGLVGELLERVFDRINCTEVG